MNMICNDEQCAQCGAEPRLRKCWGCGVEGYVTDCGHQSQPRQIAPNGIFGGDNSCDECEADAANRHPRWLLRGARRENEGGIES